MSADHLTSRILNHLATHGESGLTTREIAQAVAGDAGDERVLRAIGNGALCVEFYADFCATVPRRSGGQGER